MEFEFSKMHGLGNDYVYINCYEETIDKPEQLAKMVSDRHFGIGSDGLILIRPSEVADCRMCMYNADGSAGKMCGNGIRCVGKYVYEKGIVPKDIISVETGSGVKTLKLDIKDNQVINVVVNMGKPEFLTSKIPVKSKKKYFVNKLIKADKQFVRISCVSLGNPHAVLFCENLNKIEIDKFGSFIEHHRIFPDRTNVEFVKVIDDKHLEIRVWERGSEETLACGTGACASAAVAVKLGYCKKDTLINVKLSGGTLRIKYLYDGTIRMSGPASFVFSGRMNTLQIQP